MNARQPEPAEIRQEAAIQTLLQRMPDSVADSFSDTQLIHLKTAIGARNWGRHAVDIRGTIAVPFTRWRYYYVLLLGRNRRQLSDREQRVSLLVTAIVLLVFFMGVFAVGFLVLYLIKSYAGVDLFPGFSLGIWDYFKENVF